MLSARLAVTPDASLLVLAFVLAGSALGVVSGLVPGLHANNFALVLAAVAADVPGPPLAVGAAMLAAGVVHTFLDVVPTVALGVPDAAMATTALPGHRLVLAGRGREALRLSALGSLLAVVAAAPLALPVTEAMHVAYPVLRTHLTLVLLAVACGLLAVERTWRARLAAAVTMCLSGALGAATLDASFDAPLAAGGPLTPLFAGLFGAPVLLDAMRGAGVPPQDDPTVTSSRRTVVTTALAGTLAGAAVGYLPGVSSGVAAAFVLPLLPTDDGSRGYVVATSGVNTANAVFALFALAAFGTPRTGVLVAFDAVGAPLHLPTLLVAVAVAAVVGFCGVLSLGDRYLALVGTVDASRLSLSVLGLLVGLSFLFAGPVGVGVFAVAALVGLVPPRVGVMRVHLMGVLIVPLLVG